MAVTSCCQVIVKILLKRLGCVNVEHHTSNTTRYVRGSLNGREYFFSSSGEIIKSFELFVDGMRIQKTNNPNAIKAPLETKIDVLDPD